MQFKRKLTGLIALALCTGITALAQDIKIAHVYDKTGFLGAYAKQTQDGPAAEPALRSSEKTCVV